MKGVEKKAGARSDLRVWQRWKVQERATMGPEDLLVLRGDRERGTVYACGSDRGWWTVKRCDAIRGKSAPEFDFAIRCLCTGAWCLTMMCVL